MMTQTENELLFDDAMELENTLGENSKTLTALTGDCDCTSYTALYEDEDAD
ncbi:hypothetical protein LZF95_19620 [Algoriphagus sp. AGSA1]|uniref:hypothetical protein n=1 Tax=Algoriphagus sp. AGSA1 TaxID=2907213 RepID=UPI001F3849B2|nr:hypothetical protein [Algoriphagus sp. AGSA1]MCE7056898.1 hypothetical protein [Algoriphagus sp. AGSA1]